MSFSRLFLAVVLLVIASQVVHAQPTFPHPDRIRYDGHCFTIEGKDTFLFSGAFHYFRCPRELWRDRFRKIKEAGFNAVETYVAWNWSEKERPRDLGDFSKVQLADLDEWLTMAEDEFGLYTIVRPGPYICSEWASGGFPNWLPTFAPSVPKRREMWYRSDDPAFEAWSRHWFQAVAQVVGKHQLSKRPAGKKGMILWQVENEYDYADMPEEAKRGYVRFLIQISKELGIEVPVFGCWTDPIRHPKGDAVLAQAFDNPNMYNRWDIENVIGALNSQHEAQPWAPKMVTEFQGGWFGGVGGQAAIEQDGITAAQTSSHTLLAIANGLTGLNYYMLFGGTNFGDWAAQGITTSYDYAAPIREWGGTGDKYRAVQAIGRMLAKHGPDLARSEAIDPPTTKSANVRVYARKGQTGAVYLFVWNRDRAEPVSGSLSNGLKFELAPFATGVYRYSGSLANGEWVVSGDVAPMDGSMLEATGIPLKDATFSRGTPQHWKLAAAGRASTADLGVWDARPVFYRIEKQAPGSIWLETARDSDLYTGVQEELTLRQGGIVWPEGRREVVLFNPGWPNGGKGMETPHGILSARRFQKLPEGVTVSGWKSKQLSDPSDRSLVGEGVSTEGWNPDAEPNRFPSHTAVVARAIVHFDSKPGSEAILASEGVDDIADFYVNGHWVGHIDRYGVPATFKVGAYLQAGENVVAVVIQNNDGPGGFMGPVSIDMPLPPSEAQPIQWTTDVAWSGDEPYRLEWNGPIPVNEHPKIEGPRRGGSSLIAKSVIRFAKPGEGPWQILLQAGGDGFLTLNGHPLGRYWEVGPQRGFYLPEPWLKSENVLEYVAIPGRKGDRIFSAELRELAP